MYYVIMENREFIPKFCVLNFKIQIISEYKKNN